jgi:hypothetical protein
MESSVRSITHDRSPFLGSWIRCHGVVISPLNHSLTCIVVLYRLFVPLLMLLLSDSTHVFFIWLSSYESEIETTGKTITATAVDESSEVKYPRVSYGFIEKLLCFSSVIL